MPHPLIAAACAPPQQQRAAVHLWGGLEALSVINWSTHLPACLPTSQHVHFFNSGERRSFVHEHVPFLPAEFVARQVGAPARRCICKASIETCCHRPCVHEHMPLLPEQLVARQASCLRMLGRRVLCCACICQFVV